MSTDTLTNVFMNGIMPEEGLSYLVIQFFSSKIARSLGTVTDYPDMNISRSSMTLPIDLLLYTSMRATYSSSSSDLNEGIRDKVRELFPDGVNNFIFNLHNLTYEEFKKRMIVIIKTIFTLDVEKNFHSFILYARYLCTHDADTFEYAKNLFISEGYTNVIYYDFVNISHPLVEPLYKDVDVTPENFDLFTMPVSISEGEDLALKLSENAQEISTLQGGRLQGKINSFCKNSYRASFRAGSRTIGYVNKRVIIDSIKSVTQSDHYSLALVTGDPNHNNIKIPAVSSDMYSRYVELIYRRLKNTIAYSCMFLPHMNMDSRKIQIMKNAYLRHNEEQYPHPVNTWEDLAVMIETKEKYNQDNLNRFNTLYNTILKAQTVKLTYKKAKVIADSYSDDDIHLISPKLKPEFTGELIYYGFTQAQLKEYSKQYKAQGNIDGLITTLYPYVLKAILLRDLRSYGYDLSRAVMDGSSLDVIKSTRDDGYSRKVISIYMTTFNISETRLANMTQQQKISYIQTMYPVIPEAVKNIHMSALPKLSYYMK